jgi:hypothetical protein
MPHNVDLGGAVTDGLRTVALFIPRLVAFVVILAAGWIAAVLLQKACTAVLDRTGFDRAVERGGIRRLLARSEYDATDIVAKLVFYSVLLVAAQVAFGIWGPNPISSLIADVIAWLPRAAVAIVLVVVAAAIARAVRDVVGTALGSLSYGPMLGRVASYGVLGLGIIAALNQIGVALTVTMPVLITVLATVGGILVVGAGGGLIRPMQQRWERWLGQLEEQSPHIAEHAKAYAAGRSDTSNRYLVAPDPDDWPTLDKRVETEADADAAGRRV